METHFESLKKEIFREGKVFSELTDQIELLAERSKKEETANGLLLLSTAMSVLAIGRKATEKDLSAAIIQIKSLVSISQQGSPWGYPFYNIEKILEGEYDNE